LRHDNYKIAIFYCLYNGKQTWGVIRNERFHEFFFEIFYIYNKIHCTICEKTLNWNNLQKAYFCQGAKCTSYIHILYLNKSFASVSVRHIWLPNMHVVFDTCGYAKFWTANYGQLHNCTLWGKNKNLVCDIPKPQNCKTIYTRHLDHGLKKWPTPIRIVSGGDRWYRLI